MAFRETDCNGNPCFAFLNLKRRIILKLTLKISREETAKQDCNEKRGLFQ